MRYLDPKNDLTFKKIFGEHPDLLMSFLNALLPLPENGLIESLEYLPVELVPEVPLFKNSLVDVRCTDQNGRQFLVEMQMLWTDSFKSRVLFNASKAFVRQLEKGEKYKGLNPVYALSLVNEVFDVETEEFYHHYSIVNVGDTSKRMEGLEFVFIELPKFKAENWADKKIAALWLRFMKEIKDGTENVPNDFHQDELLKKALSCLQESAFSKAALYQYDKYWDIISTEKTRLIDAETAGLEKGKRLGLQQGIQQGMEQGIEQGIEQGKKEQVLNMAKECLKKGLAPQMISEICGLSVQEVEALKNT